MNAYFKQRLELTLSEIFVLDTETTGLPGSGRKERVLQVGAVDGTGAVLIDQLYKPGNLKSWPGAQAIHGISYEDVRELPTFVQSNNGRKLLNTLVEKARCIVFYNASFDIEMLENSGFRWNIDDSEKLIIDVMKDFAIIYGEYSDWYDDYKWQKLSKAAQYYYYKSKKRWHYALSDCMATLHVFLSMYNDEFYKDKINIIDFQAYQNISNIISASKSRVMAQCFPGE